MKVAIYSQHHIGIGHFVRSMAIAKEVVRRGGECLLLTAGQPLPFISLPPGVRLQQLPYLRFSSQSAGLTTEGGNPADLEFQRDRAAIVLRSLANFRPTWFLTEHYPFGRWALRLEWSLILQALQELRKAGCLQVAASVRDILGRSPTDMQWNQIGTDLAHFYDHLLIHSDPLVGDSFRGRQFAPTSIRRTGLIVNTISRTSFALASSIISWIEGRKKQRETVSCISLGGGREGPALIETFLNAVKCDSVLSGVIVCGPFGVIPPNMLKDISCNDRILLLDVVPHLSPILSATDCSISYCGYNTASQVLGADRPAIFLPGPSFEGQEQAQRARRLEMHTSRIEMLSPDCQSGEVLASAINRVNSAVSSPHAEIFNLTGASETVKSLQNQSLK